MLGRRDVRAAAAMEDRRIGTVHVNGCTGGRPETFGRSGVIYVMVRDEHRPERVRRHAECFERMVHVASVARLAGVDERHRVPIDEIEVRPPRAEPVPPGPTSGGREPPRMAGRLPLGI